MSVGKGVDEAGMLLDALVGAQPGGEPCIPPWIYRIGFVDDPLGFPPREVCSWQNRWSDPSKQYRTLYGAELAATCLREILADLRPNVRVIKELETLYGPDTQLTPGRVSDAWFDRHVITSAVVHTTGPIIDVDEPATRERLLHRHSGLLSRLGLEHLDFAELRSNNRELTQAISKSLWEEGAAGIRYGSNIDNNSCFALFEGRASLLQGPVGIIHFTPATLGSLAVRLHLNIRYDGWHGRYVSGEVR